MEETAKILVVDDEMEICKNVQKILSKNNYKVTHALSAQEALEKMATEQFSLMISDIVMPGKNGLELLKLVKKEWPLTKALMMTAYASTDTAVKAIRLGALDYLPKPFTPEELRSTVKLALSGELTEASINEVDRDTIEIIDIDIPFDSGEVAKYTGEDYLRTLGPSDMPVVEVKMPESLKNFCEVGSMICDIFEKLGVTCKAGNKTDECPKITAAKKKETAKDTAFDVKKLIGIDQPFNYKEVVSLTGPEYVTNLHKDGVSFIPYEELKKNVARMMKKAPESAKVYQEVMQEPVYKNILVIDDEVAVNNSIRRILAKSKYYVDQAVTKIEAIEKINARDYNLILLDLKIPGVKGLELLEAIKEMRPNAKVIIITGYASIETAVESVRMGATDYLPKPFTPEEIRNVAGQALQMAA